MNEYVRLPRASLNTGDIVSNGALMILAAAAAIA
jgi:hypothetical protein